MEEQFEMHVIVKGDVQGVGFRATTRNLAHLLGLKGTVRNLPDGNVEIYAQGPRMRLDELMQKLHQKMGSDYIQETMIKYAPVKNAHENFRIIY